MPETTQRRDMLQALLDDHRLSRDVLEAMDRTAIRERGGMPQEKGFWHQVLGYFDGYFDLVHHRVEDSLLVPQLVRAGLAGVGSPVRQMMQEHERMRPFRLHLRQSLEHGSATELHATSQMFVGLLRQHLVLEEQQIFPLVRTMLPAPARTELAAMLDRHTADHAPARRSAECLVASIVQRAGLHDRSIAV